MLKQVPPAAEETLLPRINALRRNVEVLWVLANTEKPRGDEWNTIQSTCRSLLQAAPDNRNQALFGRLEGQLKEATKQAAAQQRKAAVQLANHAVNGEGDPALAWTALEPYDSEEQNRVLSELRGKLRGKLLDKTTEERLKVLQTTFDHAKTSGNDRRAQGAVARVYDAATGILLDLDSENPRPESAIKRVQSLLDACEAELNAINHRQQAEADKKVRAYQVWALKQIQSFSRSPGWQYKAVYDRVRADLNAFNKAKSAKDWEVLREFPSVKGLLEKKLEIHLPDVQGSVLTVKEQQRIYDAAFGYSGWKNGIDSEIAYLALREATVKYLLPINPALLDTPVAQLYNKAFNDAWETLKDRPDDQLFVAEQAATVQKKGLE